MATPAEVFRAYLVGRGVGVYPGIEQVQDYGSIQLFVRTLADDIDRGLLIMDVGGSVQGRSQKTGVTLSHPGLRMTLRSLEYDDADIMFALRDMMHAIVAPFDVKVRGNRVYHVHSVYRTSDVISLGEERDTRRLMWTMDARISFRDVPYTQLED